MIRAVALFAALLVATPVAAWSYCDPPDAFPPAEFAHEPTGPYKVYDVPWDFLNNVCVGKGKPPGYPPKRVAGCAIDVEEGYWFIYLRADLKGGERDCVLEHEKGHVNGWVHGDAWTNPKYGAGGPRFRRKHDHFYTPRP